MGSERHFEIRFQSEFIFSSSNFEIQILAEKPPFADGYLFNRLLQGDLLADAPVNDLAAGVADGANDAICSLLGSHNFQTALFNNDCLNHADLPIQSSYSYKCYCDILNRQSLGAQKCLKNAAAEIKLDLPGLIQTDVLLSKCCKNRAGDASECAFKFSAQLNFLSNDLIF